MSGTMDRLRRLHGLGKKSEKKRSERASERTTERVDNAKQNLTPSPFASPNIPEVDPQRASRPSQTELPLEQSIAGIELENEGGRFFVSSCAIPIHTSRGPHPYASALECTPWVLAPFHPQFNLDEDTRLIHAAFLDTETTGLGGGAGVYSFMVGIGTFENLSTEFVSTRGRADHSYSQEKLAERLQRSESVRPADEAPTHFVLRQLFMRSPSEECAMLIGVSNLLRDCDMTVTFNGRTFDLPLLRTRFKQNMAFLPREHQSVPLLVQDQQHVDLLHPARRLWRRRLQSCRLGWLEEKILGLTRAEEDVPGYLIPHLYAEYTRNRQHSAGQMPSVFYHNREDVLSMVVLAVEICDAYGHLPRQISKSEMSGDVDSLNLPGLDLLSLGCTFDSVERIEEAEYAFKCALQLLGNDADELRGRMEGYQRLGLLYKRREQWEEATAIWQEWISTDNESDTTPYVELAKYCEWQTHDLEQAEMWTRWALHTVIETPTKTGPMIRQTEELEHRLARIERKRSVR